MKIPGFGVEEWLNEWESKADYDIAQSTISSMTMEEILALDEVEGQKFYDALNMEKMNYGDIEGSMEFKEEVSKLYVNVDPNNILQTNGATGANNLALYAIVEPDDHVIAEYPSYQQLYDIPASFGATVDYWRIYEEDDWYPRIEELKELIRPNTKVICLNNANNPTGTVLNREFLEEVVEIARSVDAYILVDEVYLPLDKEEDYSPIVDLYEKGISTNSLSKTYSAPGIRIGWTAVNDPSLADEFRKYRDYTMISNGVFNDRLAVHILKNKEKVLDRNYKIVSENLDILKAWLDSEPLASAILPRYVSTSFVKLAIDEDVETFCLKLLESQGVLLVPGTRFDMPGFVRLGYCTNKDTLIEALKRLSLFLRDYE